MLREYKKLAQQQGYAASIVQIEEFVEGTLPIDAVQSLMHSIIRNLPIEQNRFRNLIGFFDSFGLQVLGTGFDISRDTTQRKQLSPLYFLVDTLQKLWEDLKDSHGLAVVLLDDAQNLISVPPLLSTITQALKDPSVQQTGLLVGLACLPEKWREMIP